MDVRAIRGGRAYARGVAAEDMACAALEREGWTVRARRLRGPHGEIDIVAECEGLLAFIEVKARPTLTDAAYAVPVRQQARLLRAAELVLGAHPDWGLKGVRFDVMLVSGSGTVRRVRDAFRQE